MPRAACMHSARGVSCTPWAGGGFIFTLGLGTGPR